MIRFIVALLCLLAALIGLGARRYAKSVLKREDLSKYDRESKEIAHSVGTVTSVAGVILFILFGFWSTVRIVPANSVGIPVTFGKISSPINSGFHLLAPWTDVNTFSTRVQESSMLDVIEDGDRKTADAIEVRGSDGYLMRVDITIRYYIEEDQASALFKLVGSEDGIRERLVRPEARESVRVAFAAYTSEEGYTSQREAIRQDIEADLAKRLQRYGLRLDTVNVRNVAPDAVLAQAISDRAAAREKQLQAEIEQTRLVTEADTRVQVATKDAEAKVIAAQGEADANDVLTASLTPEVLELRRIEALQNATTIYVPYGTSVLATGPQTTP